MTDALLSLVKQQGGIVVADGGFATHLEDALGVTSLGDSPVWSASLLADSPKLIYQTHLDFLEAGAQIIGTATYQACHAGFQACGIEKTKATELMRSAIDLADQARSIHLASKADESHSEAVRPLIALSLGPYGAYLRGGAEYSGDYGDVRVDDLFLFHLERLRIFCQDPQTWAKIDVIAFETVPRIDEATAMLRALDAILEEGIPIKPAYISFVFPSGSGLPFAEAGTSIENGDGMSALISLLRPRQGWSLKGIGINCTKAKYIPALTKDLTLRLSELSKHHGSIEAVLFIEPDGGLVYDGATRTWSLADSDDSTTPASWEQNVLRGIPGYPARSETESPWAGVVVGGCCKATTDHIKRLIVAKAGLHPSS